MLLLALGPSLGLAIGLLGLAATSFGGEVESALRAEACDVCWIGGEDVLGECFVPSAGVSVAINSNHERDLRLEQRLGQYFLQRRVIQHCIAPRKHARQICLRELARRHLGLDLLLDAQIAHDLEMRAGGPINGGREASHGVLGCGADVALCVAGTDFFGLWRRRGLTDLLAVGNRLGGV